MTALLYLHDFDVETCEADVVSAELLPDGRTDIKLSQTCFYPRGGGQDWDEGSIRKADSVFAVEEVRLDEHGEVHHIGLHNDGVLTVGDSVSCQVNHERRRINTRLHSAAHVIDMAVASLGLAWIPAKGQHYPNLSAVEYLGSWDANSGEELRAQIELDANKLVSNGSRNSMKLVSAEELAQLCRHVPPNLPANKPTRVVLYGDFGIPCGGTHVRDIHDVGTILIPKIKEKKGTIRLSYAVEGIDS